MIVLLEPPQKPGFISGGFRYQERVFDHLAPLRGRRISTTADDLEQVINNIRSDTPDAMIVVDGLFLELRDAPLPIDTTALLHMVPYQEDWCSRPMHVIATSTTTADRIKEQCQSVSVVRPGIDACFRRQRPLRAPDGTVRILCVGTLCQQKGQARLARILSSISASWQLTLVGTNALGEPELLNINADQADSRIKFTGAVRATTLADYYSTHDLLVSLSLNESFGMAVAEAASAGLPVLALKTGEIGSFILHDRNGWLQPISATDNDIRAALDQLITNPQMLRDASAAWRPPAVNSWEDVADKFASACHAIGGQT